jgi:hypothetical protein
LSLSSDTEVAPVTFTGAGVTVAADAELPINAERRDLRQTITDVNPERGAPRGEIVQVSLDTVQVAPAFADRDSHPEA